MIRHFSVLYQYKGINVLTLVVMIHETESAGRRCLPPEAKMRWFNFFFFILRYLGHGLATNMDYESWKKRRGIMNPAFHRK